MGAITPLIVWCIASLVSNWGFGFGPGWYIALIAITVGVASGVGLGGLFFVYSKAFNVY
jgi:hypothetical protein